MSALKGFTSLFKGIKSTYNGAAIALEQIFATFQYQGSGKIGLMTAPRWLSQVSTGNTIDAAGSTQRVLAIAGHSIRKYDVLRFTSGPNIGEEVQVVDQADANSVLLGQELPQVPGASDGYTLLRPMTPTLDSAGNISVVEGTSTVIDFLDNQSMVPTGANAIPASAAAPLQVVAALAQACTRIQVISDVGEFINLYTDAAGAVLIAHLVLTPDEIVDVDIPAGTSIYIRAAKNASIDDPNAIISMNFIG